MQALHCALTLKCKGVRVLVMIIIGNADVGATQSNSTRCETKLEAATTARRDSSARLTHDLEVARMWACNVDGWIASQAQRAAAQVMNTETMDDTFTRL